MHIYHFLVVLGLSEYGGMPPNEGIPLIQLHLTNLQSNRSSELTKPVKETVNAGSSLFKSLTNWLFKRTQ